ncbi:hypothetical protein PTKIN_Ptkin16aG0502300 [Pterospermum kingtungense]
MELQHLHPHPLTANHECDGSVHCSGCGEEVSGPYFSCIECAFHLDQSCAKAPSEMNHPFHRKHSLKLQTISPSDEGECVCDLCGKDCKNFFYHCSCDLDFHIKCALFSNNMAEKRIGDQLRHVTYPSTYPENQPEDLKEAECFVCRKPLLDSAYLSPDCGFFLHKKCAELPLEIKHSFHLLILQFNTKFLPCNICQRSQASGLVYCCLACHIVIHIDCPKLPDQINHLDEKVAKAPSDLSHPFHRKHSLKLQPLSSSDEGEYFCNFCDKACENSFYHCSCGLDLHIKCALISYDMARKSISEQLRHITYPSISSENYPEELKQAECFVCCKPLLDSPYLSLDCGFVLHKNCALLPLEITHPFHLQHPLSLQFNELLPCNICKKTQASGLVYCCVACNIAHHIECPKIPDEINHPCHLKHAFNRKDIYQSLRCETCQQSCSYDDYHCSICKIAFHIRCISPPPVIEDKGHKHPFSLCWRQLPFTCDACGTGGNCISYICVMCGFIVHKNCISLPPSLDLPRHDHRLHHNYFLEEEKIKMKKCRICFVEVNTRYGSYSCPSCSYICHVNCAIDDYSWYKRGHSNKPTRLDPSYAVISDTEIRHFSHEHNLVLYDDNVDDKLCEGCILFISPPYYHCPKCDFFLHKSCAELPRKKNLWFHVHQTPFTLFSGSVFRCGVCGFECSGFAYKCGYFDCRTHACLRCAVIHSQTSKCHEHQLWFLEGKEGKCNACGEKSNVQYWCNDCNFAVHDKCLKLPQIARHKCDEHPLKLTYHDDNDYVKHHYCDICEEKRNPNLWFYYCEICDKSAHPKCVLGKYPFIKPGSSYNAEDRPLRQGDHPHWPLIFVPKVYDYPECHICRKRCVDLSLECAERGCKYTVHLECIKSSPRIPFSRRFRKRKEDLDPPRPSV